MKIFIKLLGAVLLLVLASCKNFGDDILNTDSGSTSDASVIFSSEDLAKNAVNGILVPMAETNSYRGRFLIWYGMNTDNEWYNSSESTSNDNADLCVYDAKPTNSQMIIPYTTTGSRKQISMLSIPA